MPEPIAEPAMDSSGLPPLVRRVLAARGLTDPDAIQAFCDPRLNDLHPPESLPGADAAAARLVTALRNDETIALYGDYDVDGITATAILWHVLRAARPDARLVTYVPHRLEEGYGLNADALRSLRAGGVDLCVTVDCGITGAGPARVAREVGLDLIITDHHNLPAEDEPLPDALLVHPRLPGSTYPFGDLCGAGVAFKLAWRFAVAWCGSTRVGESMQRTLLDMLPLVALGTIADVVPLVGENRVLTAYGLRLIKKSPILGLRALIRASELDGERIDSEKVGFVLAPRLNACGRMGHAGDAVRLLTEAPETEAVAIAERLAGFNRDRQRTERSILETAIELAERGGMTGPDHRAIVLAHPDWHPGVVGIVCSRLVDRFGRPTILMQEQPDGTCRGSARSIDGYSIHQGLEANAALLERFGGHDMAAGVVLRREHLEAFTAGLVAHANAAIEPAHLVPPLRIDCEATIDELSAGAVGRLRALSPFGRSNRRPTVRVQGLMVAEPPRPLGAQGRHLAVRLRRADSTDPGTIRCVWWGSAEHADRLVPGARLDLAIEPKLNEWGGRTAVEPEIRDVRVV